MLWCISSANRQLIYVAGCPQDAKQGDGAEAKQAPGKPELDAQGDPTSQQSQTRQHSQVSILQFLMLLKSFITS